MKLKFLYKIITGDLSLSARTFRSLATSDVESLLLVRQCRFLESALTSHFTTSILTSPDSVSISSITEDIIQLDLSLLLSEAATHPSQKLVHQIASSPEGSWPKLWDLALEQGVFGTTCIYPGCAQAPLPPSSLRQHMPCPKLWHLAKQSVPLHAFSVCPLRTYSLHRGICRRLCPLHELYICLWSLVAQYF